MWLVVLEVVISLEIRVLFCSNILKLLSLLKINVSWADPLWIPSNGFVQWQIFSNFFQKIIVLGFSCITISQPCYWFAYNYFIIDILLLRIDSRTCKARHELSLLVIQSCVLVMLIMILESCYIVLVLTVLP